MIYDRAALEDTIRTWAIAVSGIPAERVYWTGGEGARPPGTELVIALTLTPRAGRGAFAVTSIQRRVLAFAPRSYAISGGALVVVAHGLTSGDGPFALAGAVTGDYWVMRISADALALAQDFFDARAGTSIALPGGGSGTISGGAITVAYAAPADRVRDSVSTLELRVEIRGGTATGTGAPAVVLETLREAVDARSCPLAVTMLGAVQTLAGATTGQIRLEPYAYWTCEIEVDSQGSEVVPVIDQVADIPTSV